MVHEIINRDSGRLIKGFIVEQELDSERLKIANINYSRKNRDSEHWTGFGEPLFARVLGYALTHT